MTTDRSRTPPTDSGSVGWWGLLPDQLWVAIVLCVVTPGIYGVHLVSSGRYALGAATLIAWALLYAFLLRLAHRRGWARLGLTVPATILLMALGRWIFR